MKKTVIQFCENIETHIRVQLRRLSTHLITVKIRLPM
jgi:hypothetical protein